MKYNQELYGNREVFREAKQNARHNKHNLKRAMRYAGSDQKSASDRHFFQHQLPLAVSAATLGPTVGAYAAGNLLGALGYAAYTAPA
jgi:hypothetical protein